MLNWFNRFLDWLLMRAPVPYVYPYCGNPKQPDQRMCADCHDEITTF